MNEEYGFEIGKEGQKSLEIFDKTFNEHTKYFLERHGLRSGMHILDIGCGLGLMTQYLAEKVGPTGSVTAIDNNENQIKAAAKRCPEQYRNTIKWVQMDVYDLANLGRKYDLVYCRFVLHHIFKPRAALQQIYNILNDGGIYIGIEGIVNYAFSLPNHPGWQTPMLPIDTEEGEKRNSNIGKILSNLITETKMQCLNAEIFQPILLEKATREMLLYAEVESKDYQIYSGLTTEYDWEKKIKILQKAIDDLSVIIGFYAANFVAAKK
jgi:ubiquinone/menaquinone biosynthesis C-methylase UbiE